MFIEFGDIKFLWIGLAVIASLFLIYFFKLKDKKFKSKQLSTSKILTKIIKKKVLKKI